MTIVNILRDGTVYPALAHDRLIVRLLHGNLQIGQFERKEYLKGSDNYITEPINSLELKNELINLINASMPELFSNRYVVHLLCPDTIANKIKWVAEPNSSEAINNH